MLLGLALLGNAQAAPRVLLYTMGEAQDLLSQFGHTVICVRPDPNTWGECVDFGHTDYSSTTTLIWEFMRKEGEYWAEREGEAAMLRRYRRQDRDIFMQILPLDEESARQLDNSLNAALAGEGRGYIYHHFHDNCSTRIRDQIDAATAGALRDRGEPPARPAFRDIAESGLSGAVPLQMALSLGLGREADTLTTPWTRMLLPSELRAQVAARLGAEPRQILVRKSPLRARTPHQGRHTLIALGAALGTAAMLGSGRPRFSRAALLLPALCGLAMWIMAAVTLLGELRWNEALLCQWPTDLALPWLSEGAARRYLTLRLAGLLAVAGAWAAGLLVQPLGPALLFNGLPALGILAGMVWTARRGSPAPG